MAPKKQKKQKIRMPIRVARKKRVAAPPGTIEAPEDAKPSVATLYRYDESRFDSEQLKNVDRLETLSAAKHALWIHFKGVGDVELLKAIAKRYKLHRLIVEDMVNLHQRPKSESYDSQVFLVLKVPRTLPGLGLEQVSLFFDGDVLISIFEDNADCIAPIIARLKEGIGRVRSRGIDYLFYLIIDAIIDSYYPCVEALNDRLEALESRVLLAPQDENVRDIHAIRHDLNQIRQALTAMRDALVALMRQGHDGFAEETSLYLRDCLDHLAQHIDAVESQRQLSASLMDLHLSTMSNRMNEVMKLLTMISTIFIPLSFLAGLYGMNFDRSSKWNMPELGWGWGYPALLVLMLMIALGLVFFFYRRGWIGRTQLNPQKDDLKDNHED